MPRRKCAWPCTTSHGLIFPAHGIAKPRRRKRNEALEKQLRAIVDSPQLQAIAKSGIASVMRDERSAAPVARRAGAPGTSKPGSMLVAVPEGVEPGKQMTITSKSGKALLITVPEGMAPGEQMEVSVPLTPVPGERVSFAVPDGVRPGDQLSITAPSGREMTVTVPEGSVPGQELEVDVPADGPPPAERVSFQVPAGVGPGDSVTITAPDGREVTVTMPEGALAGATIEVELPPVDDGIQGLAELLAGTTTTLAAAPSPGPEARRAAGSDGFDSAKEALSLELASAQQRASRQEGALADMSLQLQKYEAQVKFLQISKGEMEAIAAGSGADVAGVSGLQLRLQAAQAEATEAAAALRAVRETELPQEQARAMALKQEVFRLKEAALTSEEAMLELQDELHELRQQVRRDLGRPIHRPGFLFIDQARSGSPAVPYKDPMASRSRCSYTSTLRAAGFRWSCGYTPLQAVRRPLLFTHPRCPALVSSLAVPHPKSGYSAKVPV